MFQQTRLTVCSIAIAAGRRFKRSAVPSPRSILRSVFLHGIFTGAIVMGVAIIGCYHASAMSTVPEVACSGDLAPDPTSLAKDRQIDVNLPVSEAGKLEMFASMGQLILAPRGWVCQTRGGYEGITSIKPPGSMAYGLTEIYVDGTSNRHTEGTMDEWANRYFPTEMRRETAAGIGPISMEKVKNYRTDKLKYITPLMLTYITQAGQLGVGNDILFAYQYGGTSPRDKAASVSIDGFIELITRPDFGADHVNLVALSLPRSLTAEASCIQVYAEKLN